MTTTLPPSIWTTAPDHDFRGSAPTGEHPRHVEYLYHGRGICLARVDEYGRPRCQVAPRGPLAVDMSTIPPRPREGWDWDHAIDLPCDARDEAAIYALVIDRGWTAGSTT